MIASGACWYFAQDLTDMLAEQAAQDTYPAATSTGAGGSTAGGGNSTAHVPIGLIGTYWGGTMVQMWIQNQTNGQCKNATGGPV
jgi:hypothetical protein